MLRVSSIERRQCVRFIMDVPISCLVVESEDLIYIKSHDISEDGLCLLTQKPLPVGSYLDIYIQLIDTGERIYKRGIIVWLSSAGPYKYKIGVKLNSPKIKPIPIILRTIYTRQKSH